MNPDKKDFSPRVHYFIFFSIILGFNYLLSKYQFFITEGWFETFAVYANSGIDIYKDYNYFLPPLTVSIFSGFINLFGLDFISLRYFFALIHVLNFYIIFLVLQKRTNIDSAIIGSLLTFFLIINNPAFIAKDYHTIVSLLVALLIYVLPFGDENKKINNKTPIYIGLLIGLLILTKHNIGVIFGFSIFLYINLILFSNKYRLSEFIKINLYLFVSLFAILLSFTTFISPSWLSVFSFDTPKGSIYTILFRFILDPTNRKIIFVSLLFTVLIYIFYFLVKSYKYKFVTFLNYYLASIASFFRITDYQIGRSNMFLFLVLAFMVAIFILFKLKIAILYMFALSWPLLRLLKSNTKNDVLFCIPLYTLAYCGTTTAGFNSVSLEILLALFFAELIFILRELCISSKDNYNLRNFLAPIIFVTFTFGATKLVNPSYNWWGLKTNSIVDNIQNERSFKSGYFKHIHMDKFTYDILNYADNNDINNLLATPSIPLFNLLSEKKSEFSLLYWYDVTTLKSQEKTVNKLWDSPPKDIFMLKVPDYVHAGHYSLIKKNNFLPPKEIENIVIKKFITGEYVIDFARANINYETCDDEFITNYIPSCNLDQDNGLIFYVSIENSRYFNDVIKKCERTHQCKIENTYLLDKSYVFEMVVANQYWYKELIENGKALHVNNKKFHIFYSLIKVNN